MMRFLKQSVVGENTGKYMLSLDVDNMDNRLKHDLEEAETITAEKGHNRHVQFYRTATRYLTRHLPFVNELLHDLVVLHPLMLKEDQASQVIRITAKKLSQIIRQDLCRLTN